MEGRVWSDKSDASERFFLTLWRLNRLGEVDVDTLGEGGWTSRLGSGVEVRIGLGELGCRTTISEVLRGRQSLSFTISLRENPMMPNTESALEERW